MTWSLSGLWRGIDAMGVVALVLAILTSIAGVAAVAAPRYSERARASSVAAHVSPFWLTLPWALLLLLSPATTFVPHSEFLLDALMGVLPGHSLGALLTIQAALVAAQLGLSGWVLYRHRRYLKFLLPFALLLSAWIVLVIAVDVAMAVGPLVKS